MYGRVQLRSVAIVRPSGPRSSGFGRLGMGAMARVDAMVGMAPGVVSMVARGNGRDGRDGRDGPGVVSMGPRGDGGGGRPAAEAIGAACGAPSRDAHMGAALRGVPFGGRASVGLPCVSRPALICDPPPSAAAPRARRLRWLAAEAGAHAVGRLQAVRAAMPLAGPA